MNKKYCPYCMTPVAEGESCSVCGLTSGTYVPSPHHLPPGTILMDRYLVGRVLGEGGFGITYIGRDLRLELKVAIKEYYPVDRATRNSSASLEVTNFIGPSAKSFERGKQKFLGEAQVMAKMDKQQSIVSVRDFFEINNTAYIVMEYIEGITFRELVEKKGGRILPEELFPMLEPLFHALSTMHQNGLIHRDISPDNLMLENGKIRLLDFGCAREASRGVETMTIALKHGYAPIEQYQQKGQGPWTDIYALSATIYYCLTGKVPPQALDRITEDELLLPSKLGIPLSARQEKALLKGMRLQPSRRFSTMEEMWSALYEKDDENAGKPGTVEEKEPEPVDTVEEALELVSVEENESETADTGGKEPEIRDESADIGEDSQNREQKAASQPEPSARRKRNIYLAVGAAAACAVVAFSIWAYRSGTKEVVGTDVVSIAQTEEETQDESTALLMEEAAGRIAAEPHLFDEAFVFTSGENDELQNLMEDDTVPAIIIDCTRLHSNEVILTKPVLLAEGTDWKVDSLTVTGDGYLQVEGCLDTSSSTYVRLTGDVQRIFVTEKGVFDTEYTLIWMEHDDCFARENGGEKAVHQIVMPEDIFEGSQVFSVTDEKSLRRAIDSGMPMSIDADIVLTEDMGFNVPVRISEGVTVYMMENAGAGCAFCLSHDGILVNNGILDGHVYAEDNGAVINHGEIQLTTPKEGEHSLLWFEGESTLLNFGTIVADDASRCWNGTLFFNMGTLYCYNFMLPGGNMANYGQIIVPDENSVEMISGERPYFWIMNGSCLWNMEGAEVHVENGAEMTSDGWIKNFGTVVIEDNGIFSSAVFENYGNLRADTEIDRDRAGIYYGYGEFDLETNKVKVYHTFPYAAEISGRAQRVETTEELELALEDPEAEAVLVSAALTVDHDLTLRKDIMIDSGCSLTMDEGTSLLDYGGVIVLSDHAALQGSSIRLREDAQIYMEGNAALTIYEGGSLEADSALIWGEGGGIMAKDAEIVMKNESGFVFSTLESLLIQNGSLTIHDQSVFVTPHGSETNLEQTEISLENAYFYAASDTVLKDCSLNIQAGVFRNSAGNLTLDHCSANIAASGEFCSDCSNLSLLSGTEFVNQGKMSVTSWDEYMFTLHGKITNYGNMEFSMKNHELSEPIDNQGNFYYWYDPLDEDQDWDSCVTGNMPVDLTEE